MEKNYFERIEKRYAFLKGAIIGIIAGAIIVFLIISNSPAIIGSLADKFTLDVEPAAEEHDIVLEDEGFIGYTAADFYGEIVHKAEGKSDLVIMEQPLEIVMNVTQSGLGNLSVFKKMQTVTYHGTGVYTVDLSNLSESDINVNNDEKTVSLTVPAPILSYVEPDLSKTEFSDIDKGLLAFGDIKVSTEEQNKLNEDAVSAMTTRLSEKSFMESAEDFARVKTFEVFQPVVSATAPDYTFKIIVADNSR